MTTADELQRDMRLIEVALGVRFDPFADQSEVIKRILDAVDALRIRAMSAEKDLDKAYALEAKLRNEVSYWAQRVSLRE